MAIDTAEKRRSASQVISGLFGPGITPNASKDSEWRQQAGWGYSGIASTGVWIIQEERTDIWDIKAIGEA